MISTATRQKVREKGWVSHFDPNTFRLAGDSIIVRRVNAPQNQNSLLHVPEGYGEVGIWGVLFKMGPDALDKDGNFTVLDKNSFPYKVSGSELVVGKVVIIHNHALREARVEWEGQVYDFYKPVDVIAVVDIELVKLIKGDDNG